MACMLRHLVWLLAVLACHAVQAQSKFELTWLGHAAFKIQTPSGGTLLIDPWILNPQNPQAVDTLRNMNKVDYVLVSHGHANALGDAEEILKKTGAKLVVADRLERGLIYNKRFAKKDFLKRPLRTWDSIDLMDGEVTITLVPSRHLASSEHKDDAKMRNNSAFAGAYGFIIEIVGGPTIYHTGDTKYIDEFERIGQSRRIDIMLAALSEKFTMGAEDIADAVVAIQPRIVVPMRFENAEKDLVSLERELKAVGSNATYQILKPGETLKY